MAESPDILASEDVPEWLAKYMKQARAYHAQGEAIPLDVEAVAQAAGVPGPDSEPVPKAKGVTPRQGKHGVKYEVRHKGKTIGTVSDFDEAVALKQEAERNG